MYGASRQEKQPWCLQAGLPALDFGGIRGTKQREYIAAVQAALGRDYQPKPKVFREVIARTLRSVAKADVRMAVDWFSRMVCGNRDERRDHLMTRVKRSTFKRTRLFRITDSSCRRAT